MINSHSAKDLFYLFQFLTVRLHCYQASHSQFHLYNKQFFLRVLTASGFHFWLFFFLVGWLTGFLFCFSLLPCHFFNSSAQNSEKGKCRFIPLFKYFLSLSYEIFLLLAQIHFLFDVLLLTLLLLTPTACIGICVMPALVFYFSP